MLSRLGYLYRRWRHAEAAARTPLKAMYQQTPVDPAAELAHTSFLVVDCEMNGLDPRSSELLSIGWVLIEKLRVVNRSGHQQLIHSGQQTGQSSTIHGIVDSDLAGAGSAAAAITRLCEQSPGRVLVFHHAPLDIRFLQRAAINNFRCPMLFSYIDTMEIEARRQRHHLAQNGLRLAECRTRYGLPNVAQHDALADALATAELLLAQLAHISDSANARLKELPLHYS